MTLRQLLAVSAWVLLAAVTGCASTGDSARGTVETQATPPGSTTTLEAGLDGTVRSFLGEARGSVAVLVERDGRILDAVAGEGSADGDELEPGRPFRVGSISKPFISVMALQLVDEGRLDLDTPLDAYLPDPTVGSGATIRQLLSHRSGLANYTDVPTFFPDVLADRARRFKPADVLGYVVGEQGNPVDRFAYSNTNYILLGQLIEHLDGTDLETSLQARVAGPAGLTHTGFDTARQRRFEDLVGGWSPGVLDGDPSAEYTSIATSAWAAGALVSTTADLASFLEALSAGELVSADALAEMTDVGAEGYGLGLARASFSATQSGYGHSGAIPGYRSTMAFDPDTGDTLVVLTSNDRLNPEELARQILALG